jgi:hypothetical protein
MKLSVATLHNSNISSGDAYFIIFNRLGIIQWVMLDRLIHLDQLPMVPSDQLQLSQPSWFSVLMCYFDGYNKLNLAISQTYKSGGIKGKFSSIF